MSNHQKPHQNNYKSHYTVDVPPLHCHFKTFIYIIPYMVYTHIKWFAVTVKKCWRGYNMASFLWADNCLSQFRTEGGQTADILTGQFHSLGPKLSGSGQVSKQFLNYIACIQWKKTVGMILTLAQKPTHGHKLMNFTLFKTVSSDTIHI